MALIMPAYIQRDPDYYVTDFSEYTVGALPGDWTQRWALTGYTAAVQSVAGSISGKALRFTKTAVSRGLLSWDKIPPAADMEILIRARAIEAYSNNDIFIRSACRASGAAGAENAYMDGLFGSTTAPLYAQQIAKYNAAAAANIGSALTGNSGDGNYTVNAWAWLRFRINGTSLQSAVWLDGSPEQTLNGVNTDSSIVGGGWVGLTVAAATANPDCEVDFFSVALNGKTAPSIKR